MLAMLRRILPPEQPLQPRRRRLQRPREARVPVDAIHATIHNVVVSGNSMEVFHA